MYDAVTARNILNHDREPALVAGYIDKIKLEPWSAADWRLFPESTRRVEIVKKASTNAGHVLDVEPGDATPAQAPGWAAMRRRSGFAYPTIYVNKSTWPQVIKAFKDQGVPQPLYWIAQWDGGTKTLPVLDGITAIAKQHTGDYLGVDINIAADYWPGVDPGNSQEELVATQEEINAIAAASAKATVDAWMSRAVEVDGTPPRFLPASAFLTFTNGDTAAIRAMVGQLLAQSGGATAADIAAQLLPALTSAVAAAVANVDVSQLDRISDEDAQQIAKAVTDHAAALLKPTA
jgi:hypothetical protein